MRFDHRANFLSLLCALLLVGCIESYPPPITDDGVNFLVVDGFLNSTDGTAEIKLSHAVALSSTEPTLPELNAEVTIQDTDGNTYSLLEIEDGIYQKTNLLVNNTKQYRLNIKTSTNIEYQSDFIAIKHTPPIDSVTWTPSRDYDGINILVNTHDDSKNTRYYQWTFEETFNYEAAFLSSLKIENGALAYIPFEEQTFQCWKTIRSKKILIASTDQLNQDVVYNFPVNFIPKGSQMLTIRYSILVKQMAISREAYDYWLNLQKTTENLGSLFDPQPGRFAGNIHNKNNPNDPVLGYFSVGTMQEKRIFISRFDLPNGLKSYKDYGTCSLDTVLFADVPGAQPKSIVTTVQSMNVVIGYVYTTEPCVDCRFQGGVLTKPPFWD